MVKYNFNGTRVPSTRNWLKPNQQGNSEVIVKSLMIFGSNQFCSNSFLCQERTRYVGDFKGSLFLLLYGTAKYVPMENIIFQPRLFASNLKRY